MSEIQISTEQTTSAERARAQGKPVELPAEYNEYLVVSLWMKTTQLWSWLKQRVLARRAGAYELCDVVAALVAFFTHRTPVRALRDFLKKSKPYGPELAGVLDRHAWISQPALSRALAGVDLQLARQVSAQLLLSSSRQALSHQAVQQTGYLDGQGDRWQVYHWDVTVTTLRRRALPQDEQLPEPARPGDRIAAPGYPGRKRGDIQLSRSTVSDANSALWLHADIQPGNGQLVSQLHLAAESIEQVEALVSKQVHDSVVVCDGVSGGLPQARVLREHGLKFVVRYGHYELLDEPQVQAWLQQGPWMAVQDSKSGPKRQAMSLGKRVLAGGQLTATVIVSRRRLPRSGRHRGAGKVVGSWVYELYITDLAETRWAANDVVTLYYGRTAIENRFAAEDREFALDRIFSFTGPGQLLAVSVALMIWNLRILRGCSVLDDEPVERLAQKPRPTPQQPLGTTSDDETPEPDTAQPLDPSSASTSSTSSGHEQEQPNESLRLAAERWCENHSSWHYRHDHRALQCPAGQMLRFSSLRERNKGRLMARFRGRSSVCSTCPKRSHCTPRTTSSHFAKEVVVPLVSQPNDTTSVTILNHSSRLRKPFTTLPPLIPVAPVLLPAVLRRESLKPLLTMTVSVLVPALSEQRKQAIAKAIDDADRQRRRLTIEQRIALNEYPFPDRILVRIVGQPGFLDWLDSANAWPRSG